MLRLLAPLLLAACAAPPPPGAAAPSPPQTRAAAPLGRTVVLGPLRVTTLAVVEDSRCPSAVVCVQAGTVRVSTRLETPSMSRTEVLRLDQPADTGAGCVRLDEATPYPVQPGSVAPADYRFTFEVETC